MDTTIKVDSVVRDRLAVLAGERGISTRDLVEQLADSVLTADEQRDRHAQAVDYIRTHLRPDFGPDDEAAGEELWARIAVMQAPAADSHSAA